ncbi:MAG: hypothetical protein WCV73_03380 [Patescibacteria group bacterium]|jgi:cell division septal protein FtsQ
MKRNVIWSQQRSLRAKREIIQPRSKRAHEYTRGDAVKLRKKVFLVLAGLIFCYLVYLFFYSGTFRISKIVINGQLEGQTNEQLAENLKQSLLESGSWLFKGDNFFTASTEGLQSKLNQGNLLADYKLSKKFPKTLLVDIQQKLGRLIWVSAEQNYILEASGLISNQFNVADLTNQTIPVVYDLSNAIPTINETRVNDKLVNLILETYLNLKNYALPQIELDYFKVDSSQANYLKIVTKKGFEIHVNYLSTLDQQINKLKASLNTGKIDLNGLSYINLRVPNQVIYK